MRGYPVIAMRCVYNVFQIRRTVSWKTVVHLSIGLLALLVPLTVFSFADASDPFPYAQLSYKVRAVGFHVQSWR